MTSKRDAILSWITWKLVSRLAKRKLAANRSKLGAAGAVAVVVLAGIALAGGDDEQ